MFGFLKLFKKSEELANTAENSSKAIAENSLEKEIRNAEEERLARQKQEAEAKAAQEKEAARVAEALQQAESREEYTLLRDSIINTLKDKIQQREFGEALSYAENYYEVGKDDEVFYALYNQCVRLLNKQSRITALTTQLETTPHNDYNARIKICDQLLECEPNNNIFRENKLSILKERYTNTSDIKLKLQYCNEILQIEPNDREFKKEFVKCERAQEEINKESEKRRNAIASISQTPAVPQIQVAPAVPQVQTALVSPKQYPIAQYDTEVNNIGRAIWFTSLDAILRSKNFGTLLQGDRATLQIHTHGLSMTGRNGTTQFHHTQITSMEVKKESAGFLSTVAGVVVGGLVGGVVGALIGGGVGAAASGSSVLLCIGYRLSPYDSPEVLCFGADEDSDEKAEQKLNAFIHRYYKEIRITLSGARNLPRAKKENTAQGSHNLILVLILIVLIVAVILGIVAYHDFSKQIVPQKAAISETPEPKQVPKMTEPIPTPTPAPVPDSTEWEMVSASKCAFNKAGTTLLVYGSTAAYATAEVSGISAKSCENISVLIDGKTKKTPKCSIATNAIKLSPDQRFIKNMRNAKNMTLIIPTDETTKREIVYSLKGFSKACSWTK